MICGWDDIADEDLIVSERHYPDGRIGVIYHVAYNPAQSWVYFLKCTWSATRWCCIRSML